MTPEEYNAQQQSLIQRRAIANAMLTQSMTAGKDWGNDRFRHSPWEAVANLGATYLNKQNLDTADAKVQDAAKARQAEIAQAMGQYQDSTPDAEVGSQALDNLRAAPEGELPAQVNATPRSVALRNLGNTAMGPDQMAQAAVTQAMTPDKLQEVAPNASLYNSRLGKVVYTAPAKPDTKDRQPLDELAKLNADLAAHRITQKDYDQRRELMTTRAPQLGAVGPGEDASIDAIGKATANYQLAPPAGGNRSPRGAAILAAALKYNPDYHAEEFGSRSKAYKDFATGKQGDAVKAFNVGISHLGTAQELADALKNGDIKIFNKIAQAWAEQTGSAAPTNFDTAKEVIKAEIVKAVTAGGGGQEDRARALAGLDKAGSPAELKGAIETAQKLMGGQLGGLKRQFELSTGRTDFEAMLSPDSLPYLSTKEATGTVNSGPKAPPTTNSKGWTLHKDAKGNQAYVSPDGKSYEEVR